MPKIGSADNTVRIAYWDATSLRIKLAIPRSDSLLWDIFPNNSGPPLNTGSGSLSVSVLPAGDIGVAYYDGANGDLRLAVWNKQSTAWSDDLVDGAAADVGSLSSLQTDGIDGEPVVAYLGQGALRFAYILGGLWHSQDMPGMDGESITSLSLELGLNSRRHARIAYTTNAGAVLIAALRDGVWHTEEVATSASTLAEAALARDKHLHLRLHPGGQPAVCLPHGDDRSR